MNYQKSCFGPPPPILVVLLVIAIVVAALAVRLWRQGFVLHAAFAVVVPPDYAEAAIVEMVLTGIVQLLLLTGCWVHVHMQTELTPARIRLRARAVPVHGPGYSAPSASSASSA